MKKILGILSLTMLSSVAFGEVEQQFVDNCFKGFELTKPEKYKTIKTMEQDLIETEILNTRKISDILNRALLKDSITCEDVLNISFDKMQIIYTAIINLGEDLHR